MGKSRGYYSAEFAVGTAVRIADLEQLEKFRREWTYHHPLAEEQLAFAGVRTAVRRVSFYHGADELYELDDVPGVWHEECLQQC